ncbi:MAG: hypothetical protein A2V77_18845 [Anaeromyxobacter sp. RBG_16_69_14]|nr:MAG: hypothetical protein A2V77_18845 [Anaeromyxobacter sp. RBG_16_69_14]
MHLQSGRGLLGTGNRELRVLAGMRRGARYAGPSRGMRTRCSFVGPDTVQKHQERWPYGG